MADEISSYGRLTLTNGNAKESFDFGPITDTQTTLGAHAPIVAVPTSDTVIDFGSLAAPGWVCFRNLDATNYVQVGNTAAGALVPFMRLKPNKTSGPIFLEPGVVFRWKSNSAICKVKILALET